ncbi:TVP38/TMEM64 family protein [Christiangramia sp. LLG6405-1]|uniref:TVP38/TMEM64 family protein n=1 Tax=Christiangramia sp. LLG6405-1 TaxID=3160832 RepID=UPI003869389C
MKNKDQGTAKQSKVPMYISIGILAALVGCYFFIPSFKSFIDEAYAVLTSDDRERIASWVSQFGFWGPLIIIAAMLVQMFLFVIPSALIMIVTILAYGPYWGSVLAITGVTLAAAIAYWIGAYMGPLTVDKFIGRKSQEKVGFYVERYGIWTVITARISPVFSNDATSFVAGLLRMGFWRFMGATLAGITPLTIALAYLGGNMQRLKTGLIWISVASIIGLIIYIIYDRKKRK